MHKVLRHTYGSGRRNKLIPAVACLVLLLVSLAACAPNSGILGGGNWQASGLRNQYIRLLAVDPNDPKKIYAGSEQGAVFASADAAQHWQEQSSGLPLPDPLHALALDDAGKKLYAATDKGLFVSANAARSWSSAVTSASGLPSDSYTALAFNVDAPNVVYVGTATHGVFMSIDKGVTWTGISNGLPQGAAIHDLELDPGQHQLWAATSAGVYRADEKGASWQAFNKGLPSNVVVNTVVPAAASGGARGLIYAGTTHGFFRSLDGGAHWSTGQETLAGTSIHYILIDFRSSNATTIYVGTDVGAIASDDSGQDWRGVATGMPKGQPVYALVLGDDNFAQLYAAANTVYEYPGSSGGLDATRIITILVILIFFFLLFRFTRHNQNKRRNPPESERKNPAPSETDTKGKQL
jgi:ligand-binding sensor domain-containing protein